MTDLNKCMFFYIEMSRSTTGADADLHAAASVGRFIIS